MHLTSNLHQQISPLRVLVKEKLVIFFHLHCQGKLASVNEALLENIVGFSVNPISFVVFFSPIRTNWAFFHVFRYVMHFNIKAGKRNINFFELLEL